MICEGVPWYMGHLVFICDIIAWVSVRGCGQRSVRRNYAGPFLSLQLDFLLGGLMVD